MWFINTLRRWKIFHIQEVKTFLNYRLTNMLESSELQFCNLSYGSKVDTQFISFVLKELFSLIDWTPKYANKQKTKKPDSLSSHPTESRSLSSVHRDHEWNPAIATINVVGEPETKSKTKLETCREKKRTRSRARAARLCLWESRTDGQEKTGRGGASQTVRASELAGSI